MSAPQLIVIDTETTGLLADQHVPIEVAAVNVTTGEVLHFVPQLDPNDLAKADPDALRLTRYFERGTYSLAQTIDDTKNSYSRLWKMLRGNTFAGCNPRFDAEMLCHGFGRLVGTRDHRGELSYVPVKEPWRYRLTDLSAFAAGALGLDPADIPGLSDVCSLCEVTNADPHSAIGDARAAAECFRVLMAHAAARRAEVVSANA